MARTNLFRRSRGSGDANPLSPMAPRTPMRVGWASPRTSFNGRAATAEHQQRGSYTARGTTGEGTGFHGTIHGLEQGRQSWDSQRQSFDGPSSKAVPHTDFRPLRLLRARAMREQTSEAHAEDPAEGVEDERKAWNGQVTGWGLPPPSLPEVAPLRRKSISARKAASAEDVFESRTHAASRFSTTGGIGMRTAKTVTDSEERPFDSFTSLPGFPSSTTQGEDGVAGIFDYELDLCGEEKKQAWAKTEKDLDKEFNNLLAVWEPETLDSRLHSRRKSTLPLPPLGSTDAAPKPRMGRRESYADRVVRMEENREFLEAAAAETEHGGTSASGTAGGGAIIGAQRSQEADINRSVDRVRTKLKAVMTARRHFLDGETSIQEEHFWNKT